MSVAVENIINKYSGLSEGNNFYGGILALYLYLSWYISFYTDMPKHVLFNANTLLFIHIYIYRCVCGIGLFNNLIFGGKKKDNLSSSDFGIRYIECFCNSKHVYKVYHHFSGTLF